MYKILKTIVFVFIITLITTGCTHKIDMGPNVDKVTDSVLNVKKRDYNVAYTIRSFDQDKYVVTPGGGGDDVGYSPYNDTETAFRSVLVKVFKKVYKIELNDKKTMIDKDIRFVFTYSLETDSSSDSAFTWPPTKFTISLNCKAVDKNGEQVWEDTIYDEGNATFNEFKSNFSLAAQRASEKAFSQLLEKINNSSNF